MHLVVLLLGSNLFNREKYIRDAAKHIEDQIGSISQLSHLYETEPWGFTSEYIFLNQVVVCETNLSAVDLLNTTKGIENDMGRERNGQARYTSRKIDIDILFYDHEHIEVPGLTIPHPRLHERNFTLTPLKEVMPDYVHPVLCKSIQELHGECPDKLGVKRYTGAQNL